MKIEPRSRPSAFVALRRDGPDTLSPLGRGEGMFKPTVSARLCDSVAKQSKQPENRNPPACRVFGSSRAAETFPTIQAFEAGAVAHGNVAAVRTRGRVLLEVRDGVAKRFHRAGGTGLALMAAVAGFLHVNDVAVLGQCQFTHRTVHPFFFLFEQTGDGEFRLRAVGGSSLTVAGN